MGWVLRLVETGVDGASRSVDVMVIDRPGDLGDIAALGLTLAQGKQLVALVQQAIVTAQSRDHALRRPDCRTCTTPCQIKDYRPHQIATLTNPATAASSITLTLDSTFIRSCEDGQRHLEVRLGNVETSDGGRQVFAAVAKTDTSIEALIQRGLKEVGQTTDTELTAFTDGCSGLRSILVKAGVTDPPGLDWFRAT
jgi:hypothetical protein